MKPITKYQVPFDLDGHQCREESDIFPCQMRDNIPFIDTMTYQDYGISARSKSVHVNMRRADGTTVIVFFADFAQLIPLLIDGKVTGEWAFIKRGPKYGCYMINHIQEGQ